MTDRTQSSKTGAANAFADRSRYCPKGLGGGSSSGKHSFDNVAAAFRRPFALTIDHGLVAAGMAAAIGSATFAGYMIADDDNHRMSEGAEYFTLFAQPFAAGSREDEIGAGRAEDRPSDFNVTGSIAHQAFDGPVENRGDPEAQSNSEPRSNNDQPQAAPRRIVVKGYVLRFVHKGVALVQGAQGSYAVTPGVILPEAGRVLSIERRSGRWVVVTANGLIAEPTL